MRRERIYVCHTYYHVYVACLKELNLAEEAKGGATLLLSSMSTDFGDLLQRAKQSGIFRDVLSYDEKSFEFFPELTELKRDRGSLLLNMRQRIRFERRLGQLEEQFVPVDFAEYKDRYVFCDSDPVGYYLAYKKLPYHALEDGLNCLRYRDTAREDNAGHFGFKAKLAALGLIFIQNGYSRWCVDMEVNDLSVLDHPMEKMVEVPREKLVSGLSKKDRETLVRLFIPDREKIVAAVAKAHAKGLPVILILTEPLCKDLSVRRKLFSDMIEQYAFADGKKGTAVIKPHPRDLLDYKKEFPDEIVLDARFPMEILNFMDVQFDRVVTVYTVPDAIHCAKEKIYLGNAFMDRYEPEEAHAHVTHAEARKQKEC